MRRSKSWKVSSSQRITGMVLCLSLVMLLLVSNPDRLCGAAKFPTKSVKIIVAWAPGAASDMVARFMAERLTKKWGKPVIVVNMPGGNAMVGTSEALLAPPDGYTVLADLASNTSFVAESKELPCSLESRTLLTPTILVAQTFIVAADTPWRTLKDVAEAGRKDPANQVWGILGGRGASDIAAAQFFEAAGIDVQKLKKVSFQGSALAINAVAGGHVQLAIASPAAVHAVITAGKARPLAVTTTQRVKMMPDVPTTREAGFPSVSYINWHGLSGPPGIPADIVQVWTQTLREILQDPDSIKWIEQKFDGEPGFLPVEAYRKMVLEEAAMIKRLMRNW